MGEVVNTAEQTARLEQVVLYMPEARFYFGGEREAKAEELRAFIGDEELSFVSLERFSRTDGGICYYVLLDVSASITKEEFSGIKEALAGFAEGLSERDRMVLITFGEQVQTIFTEDGAALKNGSAREKILALENTDQKTLLFEAIDRMAELSDGGTARSGMRRAAFVITDGEDIARGKATRQEAERTLKESGVPVYGFTVSGAGKEPEDIKECVNDVYLDFYLYRNRYREENGSLKAYLAVIAKRKAIACWKAGQKQERAAQALAEAPLPEPGKSREEKLALEEALEKLPELDQQIIRMKYYEGLSSREIAQRLQASAEMVKKRQQRALKKLAKLLLVVFLLAMLAACAYVALRYFGFVPGYGVNTSVEEPVYTLEEDVRSEEDGRAAVLRDAFWMEGTLIADLQLTGWEDPFDDGLEWEIPDLAYGWKTSFRLVQEAAEPYSIRLIWKDAVLPQAERDGRVKLTLLYDGMELPFVLTRAQEETDLSRAGFYELTEENGGLMAVPRLENGELVVSIYPLNEGEFAAWAFLNQGPWASYGGPQEPITATDAQGNVLIGVPESYTPFENDSYLDWYFGPAQPGEYTLHIPCVYQYAAKQRETGSEAGAGKTGQSGGGSTRTGGETGQSGGTGMSGAQSGSMPMDTGGLLGRQGAVFSTEGISFPLEEGERELDLSVPIPGGELAFTRIASQPAQMGIPGLMDEMRKWEISMEGRMEDPERKLIMAQMDMVLLPSEAEGEPERGATYGAVFGQTGEYQAQTGFSLSTNSSADSAPAGTLNGLVWRWDHPFTISMTVEEETEWETFRTQTGEGGIAVTPKRENTGTVLSVSTYQTEADADCQILPGLTAAQLSVSCPQEALTLTGEDGRVYEGSYSPGRDDTYSEWKFGSLPEGDYILHIPYLYLRDSVSRSAEIALPQSGAIPGPGKLAMHGGWLDLYEVACIPAEENRYAGMEGVASAGAAGGMQPQQSDSLAIGLPDGTIQNVEPEECLEADLKLSFLAGTSGDGRITPVYTRIDLPAADEMSWQYATPVYAADENGTALTGLHLKSTKDLPPPTLPFAETVYLWEKPLDLPIHIGPEE